MDQLRPLDVNPHTGEPYLQLSAPHTRIIITPPRMSDADPLIAILNDRRVYHWMSGPPYPYLPEHGLSWLADQKEETDEILQDLYGAAETADPLKPALGCPVRIIRELQEDGTDVYLGFAGIYRSERTCFLVEAERHAKIDEDAKLEPGDPRIVWDLAYYLLPSRHRSGIMTAAIVALIDRWAIPRLNAHKIEASVLQGNIASVRILEKLGFELLRTDENCEEIRGELRGIHYLEWTRTNSHPSPPTVVSRQFM